MKILLVLPPDRRDWYTYLREDHGNDYYLLWHEDVADIPKWVLEDEFFKEVYFWNNYPTTKRLLSLIKPDRIVFFEVIDQREIALLVTANRMQIKTFYLEHGAAADAKIATIRLQEKKMFFLEKLQYMKKRIMSSFLNVLKSKYFYFSAAFKVNSISSFARYCVIPFNMFYHHPNKVLRKHRFEERTPSKSIVFSKSNYEEFVMYTGISMNSAVFTGVPLFDKLYKREYNTGNHIVFIDHPNLEENNASWTREFHHKIAKSLFEFSNSHRIKLYIRLHPRSNRTLWESYGFENSNFILNQGTDFTEELLSSKLILSFSSTLLTGMLCAKKNIVLLGWHPKPVIFGFDFSKFNLNYVSFDISDLEEKYSFWLENNLAEQNEEEYQKFLNMFNFPFDGKAAERVIKTIIS